MKKIFLIAFVSILLSNCDSDNDDIITPPSTVTLSQNEIDDLNFLREEEKLARDVYIYSYNKYQLSVFNNISNSEQSHMNSVLELIDKYNIPDPASSEIGLFNNSELQTLYNDLTLLSDSSLVDALRVGAIIEDLDINDIDSFIANTDRQDILDVYDNLTCGSKNHIRSFTNQLLDNDVIYVPQYISIDYFNLILSEPSGSCN